MGVGVFYIMGFAMAFGSSSNSTDKTFVGNRHWALSRHGDTALDYAHFVLHAALAAMVVAIVSGTVGERGKLTGTLWYIVCLAGLVYPVAVHSIWTPRGFLSPTAANVFQDVGAVDVAGSGVIHITGGVAALMASMVLGPRPGRFYDETGRLREEPLEYPSHNVPMQLLGMFILWFGWYGTCLGSSLLLDSTGYLATLSAVTATLSGAAGCLCCVFVGSLINSATTGKTTYDLTLTMNGCLAGLVAISAGCSVVEPWAALIIGAFGGVVYFLGSRMLIRLCIDDAVDGIPGLCRMRLLGSFCPCRLTFCSHLAVHLGGGIWGVIAVGLFADGKLMNKASFNGEHEGVFYELFSGSFDFGLITSQVVAVLWLVGWSLIVMMLFFVLITKIGWFRLTPIDDKAEPDDSPDYSSGHEISENNDEYRDKSDNNDSAVA
jgi:ammonium transporter, Amt family